MSTERTGPEASEGPLARRRGRATLRALLAAVLGCALAALAAAPAASAAPRQAPCVPGEANGPACLVWTGKVTSVSDGDTIEVDLDGDGRRRSVPVRLTGFNATELTRVARDPRRRRGQCHAVRATAVLERMIRRSRGRVRLLAQNASSRSGARLRRSVQVRAGGRWRDTGAAMVRRGLGLWLHSAQEPAWNAPYSRLAQQAAAAGVGLYDTSACTPGPEPAARLALDINWDADGDDFENVNGEWVDIVNLDPAAPVALGGWELRTADLERLALPASAAVGPGGRLRVRVGRGTPTATTLFWGSARPFFGAVGDGAYLFDPHADLRAWTIYPCRWRCAGR